MGTYGADHLARSIHDSDCLTYRCHYERCVRMCMSCLGCFSAICVVCNMCYCLSCLYGFSLREGFDCEGELYQSVNGSEG